MQISLNTTKSCRVDVAQKTGISYKTVIVKVDAENKRIVVNTHKFSNTTNKHRGVLTRYFKAQHPDFEVDAQDLGEVSL